MAVIARAVRSHRGFEHMYRRHGPSVFRYTLAVLGNEADAEDATQQTFLSAYKSWERGERPRRPHNWLIAIAHNVCRQRFRERARRPAEVGLETDDFPSPEVDQLLGAAEIRSALEQLAFNQRAALVMRELGGISYRDIAATLGITESAVETLLFRARRALREQLEGDLTCGQAEAALSRRLDGRLDRSEAAALRAHLRACRECATLERSMRARRGALRGLPFPVPPPLALPAAPATVGGALLAKGAAVVAVGAIAAGVGPKALEQTRSAQPTVAPAAAAPAAVRHGTAAKAAAHRTAAPVRHRAARPAVRHAGRHARPMKRPAEQAQPAEHPQAVAAPAATPMAGVPVAAPVSTAGGTAQAVAEPILAGAGPPVDTGAVVAPVETVAGAAAAPVAAATQAVAAVTAPAVPTSVTVPAVPATVTVPQPGDVTANVTKLATP
jgi:RNA polymerase sigma-70 factor (ECF subfamily)